MIEVEVVKENDKFTSEESGVKTGGIEKNAVQEKKEEVKEKDLDKTTIEEFLLSPKRMTSVMVREKILDYIMQRTTFTDWVEERFIEWVLKEK